MGQQDSSTIKVLDPVTDLHLIERLHVREGESQSLQGVFWQPQTCCGIHVGENTHAYTYSIIPHHNFNLKKIQNQIPNIEHILIEIRQKINNSYKAKIHK